MKRMVSALLVGVVTAGAAAPPLYAVAAMKDILVGNGNTKPEQPAQNMPALPQPEPVVQAPAVREVTLPPLPPALTCKPRWLFGLWELKAVYETPLGAETDAYNLNPVQYIRFQRDSRFARYNAGRNRMDPQVVIKTINENTGALIQYLLQDAGMLFIYKDSVATETMVCFIVAETKPPFGAGNLILMPPKGQIAGRLIKVYRKVWPPKAQPKPPPPQPQPRPGRRIYNGR